MRALCCSRHNCDFLNATFNSSQCAKEVWLMAENAQAENSTCSRIGNETNDSDLVSIPLGIWSELSNKSYPGWNNDIQLSLTHKYIISCRNYQYVCKNIIKTSCLKHTPLVMIVMIHLVWQIPVTWVGKRYVQVFFAFHS